jgi:16S rRNA (uracil1498-N3)-methyltransferase
MELFFAEPAEDGAVVFGAVEARHISRVLRHRPGDRVSVTDGTGVEYDVELTAVGPKAVTGRVLGRSESPREPAHRLTLAQAVLKGEHLAQACAQATELGIASFIPLLTARTVGRYGPSRYERLKKVTLAALKSSTRTRLPAIEARALTLEELLERRTGFGQALVAYEDETGPDLAQVLDRQAGSVLLVVGPEGGFEPEEVARLKAAGVTSFTMGPRRLRAETAAVAVTAMALQLLGDLGQRRVSKPHEGRC